MNFFPVPIKYRLLTSFAECWLNTCRPVKKQSWCARKLMLSNSPVIIALWHQSLIYTLYHFSVYPGVVMVSGNRDGEWVSESLKKWGQIPVRGSRHKGGLEAVREMGRIMKEKRVDAGIVADGSQGPARKAQLGAVILARDTGFPIIPTGFASKWSVRFNSWDRMILPLPFSRVVMSYGEPIRVCRSYKGLKVEEVRSRLEEALDKATSEAEKALLQM